MKGYQGFKESLGGWKTRLGGGWESRSCSKICLAHTPYQVGQGSDLQMVTPTFTNRQGHKREKLTELTSATCPLAGMGDRWKVEEVFLPLSFLGKR